MILLVDSRRWLVMAAMFVGSGCETTDLAERDSSVDTVTEGRTQGVERWECGDRFDGCGFGGCPVTLTADFDAGIGTVKFAGVLEYASFRIHGLERRWDWCPGNDGSFECSFVLSSDGDGSYYNFAVVMPDSDGVRRTKPADLFKCTRRRARRG